MRKFLSITTLFAFALAGAQCTITGPSTMSPGTPAIFSADAQLAQCPDCFRWTITGNNASITGDAKKNSVTVMPNGEGRLTVSVGILAADGYIQCSKSLDIIGKDAPPVSKPICNISVTEFKEVKYDDTTVMMVPSQTDNDYKYVWTVELQTGEKLSSSEKIPRFSLQKDNPIRSLSVRITNNTCQRTLNKAYEAGYWSFFGSRY